MGEEGAIADDGLPFLDRLDLCVDLATLSSLGQCADTALNVVMTHYMDEL